MRRVLRDAGVKWEVVAGYQIILEEGLEPLHFLGWRRQKKLVAVDRRAGQDVQLYAGNMVAAARQELQLLGCLPGASRRRGFTTGPRERKQSPLAVKPERLEATELAVQLPSRSLLPGRLSLLLVCSLLALRFMNKLQAAGITREVVADYVLEEGAQPFHFSDQRQEQLVEVDQHVGQELDTSLARVCAAIPSKTSTIRLPQLIGSVNEGQDLAGGLGSDTASLRLTVLQLDTGRTTAGRRSGVFGRYSVAMVIKALEGSFFQQGGIYIRTPVAVLQGDRSYKIVANARELSHTLCPSLLMIMMMSTNDENDDWPPTDGTLPAPARQTRRSSNGGAATVRNSPFRAGRTTGAAGGGGRGPGTEGRTRPLRQLVRFGQPPRRQEDLQEPTGPGVVTFGERQVGGELDRPNGRRGGWQWLLRWRPGQGFRYRDARRRTRSMEALARSAPVAEQEPGDGPVRPRLGPDLSCGRGGAGLLGRRVRVWWTADETTYAGVVHAWEPGSGLHVVRYDDGEEVSHDLDAEQVEWGSGGPEGGGGDSWSGGQAESPPVAGMPEARLRGGESASSEELGSPPVPAELEGLLSTPVGAQRSPGEVGATVEDDGAGEGGSQEEPARDVRGVEQDGADDEAGRPVEELAHVEDVMVEQGGVDGEAVRPIEAECGAEHGNAVEEAERPVQVSPPGSPTRLVGSVGMPLPSPGRERSLFVGRLFRPVEGDWYSHDTTSMPPSQVVGADGEAATFSWLFCPMILDAVGWAAAFPALPRSAEWTRLVQELRQVLQRAGVTWEVVAGFIVDKGVAPFHFDARRQEELINMDVQNGARVGMVTEFFSSRGRHSVQFDDNGQVMQVDLSNSRCAVEYLAADGVSVLSRRNGRGNGAPGGARRVGGRSDLGEDGGPPMEACEAPITEDGDPEGEPGRGGRLPSGVAGDLPEAYEAPIVEEGEGGDFAFLSPTALEALLRGSGGEVHMVARDALGRDLSEEELDAVDRGLLWPEQVVRRRGAAYLLDGEVVYHQIARGTLVTPSLHAVFAAGLVGEGGEIMDPVPIIQVMEVEADNITRGGLGVAEAATALPAEVVRAEYVEAAGGAVDRPGYVRDVPLQLSSGAPPSCLPAVQRLRCGRELGSPQ
ncbi:hypothetical protein CYMTET_11447 [Cymbomonas tetramitiformis]|uniref:Tudor domain-containing protein n=1 Tax=Cymbomonas tetramitiformis TaxID=36881 RepID=A0AAE0GM35_9CHLO|nr:hypothetical protein CYMTET_11447 [Cymbomonas tetramitiformis]